jgi:ribulose-phosphate 3-epimerase
MARQVRITASILSADFAHLQDAVDSVASADAIQIDVMDGHFVPAISFGVPVVKSIKTKLPLDIHLMVTNPSDRIAEFLALRASIITFHVEAPMKPNDRAALIETIRAGGAKAGIAINPGTSIDAIDDILDAVDLVLVMSVHPGFSGQEFIPDVVDKIRTLRARKPDLMIQVDGGINAVTGRKCREAGADNLVAASFIFSAKDRAKAIADLRE